MQGTEVVRGCGIWDIARAVELDGDARGILTMTRDSWAMEELSRLRRKLSEKSLWSLRTRARRREGMRDVEAQGR